MSRDYDAVAQIFTDKGCELYTSKDDYKKMIRPNACVFSFIASCGHNNTVTLTFRQLIYKLFNIKAQ